MIFVQLLLDVIVNNAGILRDKSFARISDADWGKPFSFIWYRHLSIFEELALNKYVQPVVHFLKIVYVTDKPRLRAKRG